MATMSQDYHHYCHINHHDNNNNKDDNLKDKRDNNDNRCKTPLLCYDFIGKLIINQFN